MRSLFEQISRGAFLNLADTATTTSTSAALDTLGFATAVLSAQAGLNTQAATPSIVVSLLECATSGGSYTACLAVDGNAIAFTLTGNGSGGAIQNGMVRIEGLGLNRKRFLKIQIVDTVANSNNVVPISAHIEMGRSHKLPAQSATSTDY